MKSVSKLLVLLGTMLTSTWLMASDVRLMENFEIKVYERGELYHVATLPAGTEIRVDDYDSIGPSLYENKNGRLQHSRRGWIRLDQVLNAHIFRRGSELSQVSFDINRNSRRERFFVSETIFDGARLIGSGRVTVREEVVVTHTPARREVYVDHSFNSYDVCYLQPRQHLVTIKEGQARRGRRNTAIGVGIGIAGILLGGSDDRGVQNLGTAMAVGGAVLATVGLVQWSDSKSVVTTYDERCDRFYTRDTTVRQVYIEGQRCSTERYYSRSWDREVEYFQTTCSSGRYYSFERNNQIW